MYLKTRETPTAEQLKAFWLFVVKNYTYKEIAQALGISVGAVAMRIYRIRKNEKFIDELDVKEIQKRKKQCVNVIRQF